jgi:hypothetical protein
MPHQTFFFFFFFFDPCLLSYGAEPYGGHYLQYRAWLFVFRSGSCMSVLFNGPCGGMNVGAVLRRWVMFVQFECVSSFPLLLPNPCSFLTPSLLGG